MKTSLKILGAVIMVALKSTLCAAETPANTGEEASGALKLHGIFSSNMVLQRGKPIVIWGWAGPGEKVSVQFGKETADASAAEDGRWETTFPAREANTVGQRLTVISGAETNLLEHILVGDVWVMNGQSNMAWGLGKTEWADLEAAQAHLPFLRYVGIAPNEQRELQVDIPARKISGEGWVISTPQTAGGCSAIGFAFGARLQRALQIPIGIIDNARGGASLESLVPAHKFKDHEMAAAYMAHLQERIASFDPEQKVEKKWEGQLARLKNRGVPEEKWPQKPGVESLRSWDIPGMSPSDAASCYNGMFGAFKGLNIKGVLFHQGYNNAQATSCRPLRYRVLMQLMVEGWREDFNDPGLPVGVIGLCAGSISQTRDNFEIWTVSPGSYIREAQRLGLADVGDPEYTAFLPAYDVRIPGLHPRKKRSHGIRAARWALNKVYGMRINWETASLVSARPEGERMVLTFDKAVMPDDMSMAVEGFSIAGKDRKFYRGYAWQPVKKDAGIWNTANKSADTRQVMVWSPLVPEPVAVRYAWARSPMGNLKVNGKEWLPLHSFRTDDWDWPEGGPETNLVDRASARAMNAAAGEQLAYRRQEEARRAPEILAAWEALLKQMPGSGVQP